MSLGIHNINHLPAIRSSHQLKNINTAMVELVAKIKFVRRPNAGEVAVNFYSIINNPFIINRCVECADCFYQIIYTFS